MDSVELFFKLLGNFPQLAKLWDQPTQQLRIEEFEIALRVMSHGEIEMAKFFAAVWFHDNQRYGFDIVDAMAVIDDQGRKAIQAWLNAPFYP